MTWHGCSLGYLWCKLTEVESRIQGSRPRTQKYFKAKDQGHRRKCSPKKRSSKIFFRRSHKKVFENFFQGKKDLQKFLFRRSLLEETKKRFLQIFREVSGVLEQNFNSSKIVPVLEPRTDQFSRT